MSKSIRYASGFTTIKSRSSNPTLRQDTDVSLQPIGAYEFVLKPGSTATLELSYDFCPLAYGLHPSRTIRNSELTNMIHFANSTNQILEKMSDDATVSNDQLLTPVGFADAGIQIHPAKLTRLSDHSISVTYAIAAEASAARGTYVTTSFYGICPGELLTIGETPNDNSIRWATGTFYGC